MLTSYTLLRPYGGGERIAACGNIEEEIASMTTAEQGQKPWIEALREELGDAVSSEPQDLQNHGHDEGYRYENRPPECVAYARNKEDVISEIGRASCRERV